MRVLLAEDDPLSRDLVTRILRRAGHEVTATENGHDAVAAFRDTAFDVVVMDLHLPGLDGLAATAAIRAVESARGGHTPIVALTAQADGSDRRRCLAAGMDAFLTKPFEIRELLDVVASRPARQRAPAPARQLAIVDWDAALATVGGNRALLARMSTMFLEVSVGALADVRAAVAARDADAIARSVHQLKGSASHFAAARAVAAAGALERAATDGDRADVEARFTALDTELAELRRVLAKGPPAAAGGPASA